MIEKQNALNQILKLMTTAHISIDDISFALQGENKNQNKETILSKLLAYLGGVFVLSGIAVYTFLYWKDLDSLSRTFVTLGVGFISYLLAIYSAKYQKWPMFTLPLFLIAALLECLGLTVYLYEYLGPSNTWQYAAMFIFGTLFLQFCLSLIALQRIELMFFSLLFGANFSYAFLNWIHDNGCHCTTLVGLGLLIVLYFIENTRYRNISPFWYFVSSALFFCGFFCWVNKTPFELVYIPVCCVLAYISVLVKSRVLLFMSVLALFGFIGDFTQEYFVGTLGWPLSLIGLGLLLCALSAIAFKINKSYIAK